MNIRSFCWPSIAFAAFMLATSHAWGLGFELSETKEQLKLKYDVSVTDHGTGRVTIQLTIADEGRLAPLDRGVDLVIPSKDGTGYVDLSVSLERRKEDGKQVMRAHLTRDLAERGEIQLKTGHLDGVMSPETWYYHRIPIDGYLTVEAPKVK